MRALVAGFVVLSGAVLAAPAWAQDAAPAPAPANPIQVLDDCVSGHARRLEVSGEAADVVAQAAVALCGRELTAASQTSGVFGKGAGARDEMKASMRDTALVEIVEMRAARNAAKAQPAPATKPSRAKRKANP